MAIKRLISGCYEVTYSKRHPITKQSVNLRRRTITKSGKREPIKTKAEARRVFADLVHQVNEKIKEKILPVWKELIEMYIEWMYQQDFSIKTVESYAFSLRAYTNPEWGYRFPDTITSNEIRALINEKVGKKSESHKKNVLKYIRGVFNYALDQGFLNRNPCPSMKFRVGDKQMPVLTSSQATTLLTQAKLVRSRWYEIWAFALYTGMRNGELYALGWDNVNLEQRTILVNCSWNNKDGFKNTKSGDDRVIEIAPPLVPIIKELKLRNSNSPLVLPRIDAWDKGEQARELRMFLEGLGLPRIRFHDLRATWATLMLQMGISGIQVMSMGGWKDLKTMQY